MALHLIEFTIKPESVSGEGSGIPKEWSHTGVVGSGDMEVLLVSLELGGSVKVRINTPVTGFDAVWEKVIRRFVADNEVSNVSIEINDNNATPYIVAIRLKQALIEARGGAK